MTRLAALFDLDGVLIDSETAYTRIWTDIDTLYPTGIEDFALKIKGSTLEGIFAAYYPDPSTRRAIEAYLRQREDEMEYELFPGVRAFLSMLQEAGIPSAIVTSSGPAKMRRLFGALPDFGEAFAAVITDADVSRSKPDPEGYLLAAQRLGARPEDSFVFEDSYNGLRAGRAAGATVIALSTTNPAERLEPLADAVIAGFEDFDVDAMLRIARRR